MLTDFVKIHYTDRSYELPTDKTDFTISVNNETGETDNKKEGKYFGMQMIKYPSERIMVKGSIHKFFNRTDFNGNDFDIKGLSTAIQDLKTELGLQPEYCRLENIEIGVNIQLPFDPNNDLGILTKEFAEKLISSIENLLPLPIKDCQKASRYIDRSFNDHNNIPLVSDFETLLKYALNIAVHSCAVLKSRKEVANILRFYQPTFPENRLNTHFKNYNGSLENEIKYLFETGQFNFEKLKINGEIPLSYHSVIKDEIKRNKQEIIDIVGYLVPLSDVSRRASTYPWPSFSENEYPIGMPTSENEKIIPLFIKCDDVGNVTGSDLVPAVLNETVMHILPELQNDIKSKFWRVGRNWGNNNKGISANIGYFSTVSLDKIDNIKSEYKVILRVFYGYNSYMVDIFEQKILSL